MLWFACSTHPSGLTSTRAVKTGCSLNPRKSKDPSVHTNVSSPTLSTFSPSSVLYWLAGKDMYSLSDRPPFTSSTSMDPTLTDEKDACLPSRRRNSTTASGRASSASGRQSVGDDDAGDGDVDVDVASSTARAATRPRRRTR